MVKLEAVLTEITWFPTLGQVGIKICDENTRNTVAIVYLSDTVE